MITIAQLRRAWPNFARSAASPARGREMGILEVGVIEQVEETPLVSWLCEVQVQHCWRLWSNLGLFDVNAPCVEPRLAQHSRQA